MTTSPRLHVSDLAIDRMLAGELPAAAAAALRDHAAGCARCEALLVDARATRAELAAEARPAWLEAAPPVLPLRPAGIIASRRASTLYAAAAALAAVIALVVVWPRVRASSGDPAVASSAAGDGVRTKGEPVVGFYVAHGADVRRGALHETVAPGDRIELFTSAPTPGIFAAVSIDAAGVRSVYVEPQPVAAGPEQLVPHSIELDAAPGTETVTGIFCRAPFDASTIDLDGPPEGCTLDHFTLAKATR